MPDHDLSIWTILIVTIALVSLICYTYGQQVVGQSKHSASQGNVTTNSSQSANPESIQQRNAANLGAYIYGGTAFVVFVLAVLRFRFYKSNVRAAMGITILIMSLIVWFQSYNIKYRSGGESFAFLMLLPCFWILLTGRKKM